MIVAHRAVVIGAGWAGEGHVNGLRDAGVEVVALCGRTPEPARQRAAQLRIPNVRFDWRAAIEEFEPDIVTVATPADTHREMTEFAARAGCHVVCEKPLAANPSDAAAMLRAVDEAGVKHGYAATGCYAPAIMRTKTLLAEGLVGELVEIESVLYMNIPASRLPFSWFHRQVTGGGLLNNVFTHKLAQVLRVTGGHVSAAFGEATMLIGCAPVGPVIHDFREVFQLLGTWSPSEAREWRECDADMAYTVTLRIELPGGKTVNAVVKASLIGALPEPEFLAIHGDMGSLVMRGTHAAPDHIRHFVPAHQAWQDVVIPEELDAGSSADGDRVQRCWNRFFRDFVMDIDGAVNSGYPTFRDGWLAAEAIGIVRRGNSWTPVPEFPSAEQPVVL